GRHNHNILAVSRQLKRLHLVRIEPGDTTLIEHVPQPWIECRWEIHKSRFARWDVVIAGNGFARLKISKEFNQTRGLSYSSILQDQLPLRPHMPQNAPRGAQVRSEAECLEVHPVEWGARKKRRSRWERTKRNRLSRL